MQLADFPIPANHRGCDGRRSMKQKKGYTD